MYIARGAKPGVIISRLGIAGAAIAAMILGAAVTSLFLQGGSPAPSLARDDALQSPVRTAPAGISAMSAAMHRDVAVLEYRTALKASRAARRRHLAALAARQSESPSGSSSAPPPPSTGGGNAADSPLGVCIRDAEEGGSYAWGPGNGGGAYQFELGTWERYGGAASEFGVAGPAYQDRVFDNAIAAGGASNWTDYDGC